MANDINPATPSGLFVRMVLTISKRTTDLFVRVDLPAVCQAVGSHRSKLGSSPSSARETAFRSSPRQ
jgi:hypothetical protein